MNILETLKYENDIIEEFVEEQSRQVLGTQWEPNVDTDLVQQHIDRALLLHGWIKLHPADDIVELKAKNRELRLWLGKMRDYMPYELYRSAASHSHSNTGWTFHYGAKRIFHKLERLLEHNTIASD